MRTLLLILVVSITACATSDDVAVDESASVAGPVLMGVDASAEAHFKTETGLAAQVVRVYLKQGDKIPASTAAAGLDAYYAAGEGVVYSIKADNSPDSEATNKANLAALAKNIVAGGHASRTWIVLHHEPYHELTGAQFQTMYSTYAPSVRNAGVKCGVIYQSYPLTHGLPDYAEEYTSGILGLVDFIGIDIYPSDAGYGTNILSEISPFSSYAKSNGKPFQIDEVAVDNTVTGTQAQEAAWLGGLSTLGSDVTLVMYYEGSPSTFANLKIGNNPQAVATWQSLYAKLTTR
jgi:hypothetical protein